MFICVGKKPWHENISHFFSFPSLAFSCKCSHTRHHKPSQTTSQYFLNVYTSSPCAFFLPFTSSICCQLGAPSGRAFAVGWTRTTYTVPAAKREHVSCLQVSDFHLLLVSLPQNSKGWCGWRTWLQLASCHPVPRWAGMHVSNTLPMLAEGVDDLNALAIGRAMGHLEGMLPGPPQAHPKQHINRNWSLAACRGQQPARFLPPLETFWADGRHWFPFEGWTKWPALLGF